MTDEVTVTQADRDLVAEIVVGMGLLSEITGRHIRQGLYDNDCLPLARQRTTTAVPDGVVEALSWWRVNASTSRADAIGLRFYVYHNKAGYWSAYTEGFQTWNQECDSEEDAKRAAQAEFERRIYSALQQSGQTAPAGDVVEAVATPPVHAGDLWIERWNGSEPMRGSSIWTQDSIGCHKTMIEHFGGDEETHRSVSRIVAAHNTALTAAKQDSDAELLRERVQELEAELKKARSAHWFYYGNDCESEKCRFDISECISEDFEWDNRPEGDHVLLISGARPVPDMWVALHYFTEAEKDERDSDDSYTFTVHDTKEAAQAYLDTHLSGDPA